jgi:hypothetical protein
VNYSQQTRKFKVSSVTCTVSIKARRSCHCNDLLAKSVPFMQHTPHHTAMSVEHGSHKLHKADAASSSRCPRYTAVSWTSLPRIIRRTLAQLRSQIYHHFVHYANFVITLPNINATADTLQSNLSLWTYGWTLFGVAALALRCWNTESRNWGVPRRGEVGCISTWLMH